MASKHFPVEVYNQKQVPRCPACGSDMWDNRQGKKKPYFPDFRCKQEDGECKVGFVNGERVPIDWPTGATAVYVDGPEPDPPPDVIAKEVAVTTNKINGPQLGNAATIASNFVIAAGVSKKDLDSGAAFSRFGVLLDEIYRKYKRYEDGSYLLDDPIIAGIKDEVETWTE